MKIICTKQNLAKGVSIVSKAVPSKTTMPILECILIDASTDVIKLTANDMELGIETSIDGEIIERGILALNAKIFAEIVRKLPDNEIIIDTQGDNQALITGGKAKFKIASLPGDEFSYLPNIEKDDFITVSEFTLKEVIRQTIFSIADSDTNKMMTGELFEIEDNILKVVSLDGHRISIRKIELKDSYAPKKVIVPGKTLQEISKIIASDKVFFNGRCKKLTIPAPDGEKGVLAHHENMVIAVVVGIARMESTEGEVTEIAVGTGFAEIVNNRVTLLVDTAERPEDIDVRHAREQREHAQERMRQKQSIQEYYHTQASLARAMNRLKLAQGAKDLIHY